jgi:hypothetical protein
MSDIIGDRTVRVLGRLPAGPTGGVPMAVTKRRIVLTPDNYPDYLPCEYPESLLDGKKVGEGGIDPQDPLVEQFCAWVNAKNARSKRREYVLTRSEASNILEWLAGWPDAR